MKDFELDLKRLDAIRRRMGAKLTNHEFKGPDRSPMDAVIREKLYKGIDANLDKIETQDGFFIYEGYQIVIYIKDHTRKGGKYAVNNPSTGNKVHLYDCETITKMKRAMRFERYRQTDRRDNKYLIDVKGGQSVEAKLYPCQNCLTALNYKNFKTESRFPHIKFLDAFDLEEFFGTYSTFFTRKPEHSDVTAPHSDYPKNWYSISQNKKEQDGWICDRCGDSFLQKQQRKNLHVHHINGVKSDVRDENLRCLCMSCHAKQPYHSHMKHQP